MRHLAVVALLVAPPARADDDAANPRPRVVHGELDGTTAKLVGRFELRVEGPSFAEDVADLTIPSRAIVTGGTAHVGGGAYELELEPAEAARTTFEALADAPAKGERSWAIRFRGGADLPIISLDIAAPHGTRLVLDVELEMPTCLHDDVRYAALPASWLPAVDPALRRGRAPDDEVDAACPVGVAASDRAWIAFATSELAARPFGDGRIGVRADRLPLADRHLARVELGLARETSEVPADLVTAIVVDGSRSMTPAELEAQRAVVASYLKQAPHSRVQVIAFARTAKPLLPGWSTATEAAPRVDRELRALATRNGSNLDVGLAEAGDWLSRITGTRRIVVFTDDALAQRLLDTPPAALERLVPDGTLIHVVVVDGTQGAIARDDGTHLAPLAMATDGIAVRGRVDDHGTADALVLVRPISLDSIHLRAPGWQPSSVPEATCSFDADASMLEGSSCTWWGKGDVASGPVTIEGLLWGRRFVRMVRPDASQSRTLARVLAVAGGFDEAVQHQIDLIARAVDSVWSLAGTWGGPAGYADLDPISQAGTTSGDFGGHSVDIGIGTPGVRHAEVEPDLRDQVVRGTAGCARGTAPVEVTLETTFEEIVDVSVVVDGATLSPGAARRLHDCIVEAVWDTFMAIPKAASHATTTISL